MARIAYRVLLAATLAASIACSKARSVAKPEAAPVGDCTRCHGGVGEDSGAPPAAFGTAAHAVHVNGGAIGGPFACETCHVDPRLDGSQHMNGSVDVVLSGVATGNGAVAARFDPPTESCTTYCHGVSLEAGGSITTPVWTKADGTQAACGTCHGNPPPAPHPAWEGCSDCHPTTVAPDGSVDVVHGFHVNGTVEVSCGGCHLKPPATGAHLAHAAFPEDQPPAYGDLGVLETYAPSGAASYRFGCGHCHPLDATRHLDGTVEVELSPAVAPQGTLRARNRADAAYDPTSGTCDGAYCHSTGQATPSYAASAGWTSGESLGCDGCHGNPPAYPSAGPGVAGANSHLGLADGGREWGHYAGLPGPSHGTKHGGGALPPGEAAAPITCQTCHYDTTDPVDAGPSGFYWLSTDGDYALEGGDPTRAQDLKWQVTQCRTCHGTSSGPPARSGRVLPLRHVNGRVDVVFDARTALPAYAGLPSAPDTPTRPYWLTHRSACIPLPPDATLDGSTLSFHLAGARFDAATKTCTNVACHLGEPAVWGRVLRTAATPARDQSCCRCHAGRCG